MLANAGKLLTVVSNSGITGLEEAIIAGVAVVLAAAIPAILSLQEKEPKELKRLRLTDENYHKELVRGKEEAEAELENAQHTINTQNTEIRKYREFISRLRYDPDTLRKIGGPSA
jgi:chromosome segregation ATPase